MRGYKLVTFEEFSFCCSVCAINADGIRRCYYEKYHRDGVVCAPSTCPRWRKINRAYTMEAGRTVRPKRAVQQRKVRILSEEEFVESLKKRIPTNKWNLGPSAYVASIAYRHFILMLKTQTVA
jgi:hypothetical protein